MKTHRTASPNRVMQVLLAPIVSEKSTMIGEKNNQYAFRVLQDATKAEVKAAIETFFKVDVDSVNMINIAGKKKRFGQGHGPQAQRAQGLREPEERPRNQFRGDQVNAGRETQADLAGPPRDGQGRQPVAAQGPADLGADRIQEARLRTQQPRPHHDAPSAAAATSATTGSSISVATRTASRRKSSGSNTIRTAARTLRCCATPTASAATSWRRAVLPRACELMSGSEAPIRPAIRCRSATSRSAPRSTASRCCRARAARSRARPAARRSCWLAKAPTLRSGCVRARSARSTSTAAPRWVKSATKSTICGRSARPARRAGAASARRFAASP